MVRDARLRIGKRICRSVGYPHRFSLTLVPSGTDFPVPLGIPAVQRQTVQAIQRTPETWHWSDKTPPSKTDGLLVID